MHPKKILHPTDYSAVSCPALREALEVAEENGAALVLLHVVETLGPEAVAYGELSLRQPETYRKRLWDELHHVLPADADVQVEFVLSEEEVVTAILRTAAECGCDLIVMGTRGVKGWQRWFTESVAEKVVRSAACSVLVVKKPEEPQPLPEYSATQLHPGHLMDKEPGK